MGMLMHHTWLEQQKQSKLEKRQTAPVVKAETEKPPVKRTGGRPKKK